MTLITIYPLDEVLPLINTLYHYLSTYISTSLILVSRETPLQARLLPVVLSAATLSMTFVQVQSGVVAILCWFLA